MFRHENLLNKTAFFFFRFVFDFKYIKVKKKKVKFGYGVIFVLLFLALEEIKILLQGERIHFQLRLV